MMRRILLFCLTVWACAGLLPAQSDSLPSGLVVLYEEEFLERVLAYHPQALQAGLLPEAGRQIIRSARGGFDPKIVAGFDQKDFADKNYYQTLDAALEIPTWYGIKAVAGYMRAEGEFLNPADYTVQEGQAAIGIEWTPLRGLVIDKRRAALQKAQIFAEANEAQRIGLLNDLLAESAAAYWEWVRAWHARKVYEGAVQLSEVRYTAVRGSWRGGARPAIDTTEALIQIGSRQVDLEAARFKELKARLYLETFLWNAEGAPLELGGRIVPPALVEVPTQALDLPTAAVIDSIIDRHPDVMGYALKLDKLEVDRRFQAEQLKPELSIKYQWLGNPPGTDATAAYQFGYENYKLGVGFAFPLFLREARGNLAQIQLEVQAVELELDQKRRSVFFKAQSIGAGHAAVLAQVDLSRRLVEDYRVLVRGEGRRFDVGESSLFLVNAREQSLIKAELDYIALLCVLPVQRMDFYRAIGGAYLLQP
jgi:outer membrane protein TolC